MSYSTVKAPCVGTGEDRRKWKNGIEERLKRIIIPSLTANKPRIPYFREIPACFMFKNVVYG